MSTGGSRWTKQLKVIIDVIYSSDEHLTADDIYAEARGRLPNISLGTVYRNLNKLVSENLISETKKGNTTVFLKHPFSNVTFECERCHKLISVPFEIRLSEIEKQTGTKVNRWNMHLSGICQECDRSCT